eukprot:5198804-Pleurochrysis_carterae.AAC.2
MTICTTSSSESAPPRMESSCTTINAERPAARLAAAAASGSCSLARWAAHSKVSQPPPSPCCRARLPSIVEGTDAASERARRQRRRFRAKCGPRRRRGAQPITDDGGVAAPPRARL